MALLAYFSTFDLSCSGEVVVQMGKWRFSEAAIIGLVLGIQGFGSALAKSVWNANWGLLAVAERWTPVPVWIGVAVGVVGLVVIVLSRRRVA
jgi:hypothetical protein